MNFHQPFSEQDAGSARRRDPAAYFWMNDLPRLGWAWEFVRRNPKYRADYASCDGASGIKVAPGYPEKALWPLLRFEDPHRDARQAEVLWQRRDCPSVLPLSAVVHACDEPSRCLLLEGMQCRVAIIEDGDLRHVLFTQDGRSLQLEVRGSLSGSVLLTPALPCGKSAPNRIMALKRLNDVVTHGTLRPQLYPREKRGPRLVKVMQALDGWLANAHRREIAISLFGQRRVESDWSNHGDHLRDQVRRAINYGRMMMESGYRRLLG